MKTYFLAATGLLLLASCSDSERVTFTTPTTPPESGYVSSPSTPAPTSANTVDPVPPRILAADTLSRPLWLQRRIAEILAERKRTPLIRVLSYEYKGQLVYFESAPCCDQYSTVYDTRGRVLCHPDGGITGKGDGECADFDKNKSKEMLVWQDPR